MLTKKIPLCKFKNSPTDASAISLREVKSSSAYLEANLIKESSSVSI